MVYLFSSKPRTIVEYFERNNIAYQLVTLDSFAAMVQQYEPIKGDIGIVYDFGKFIPEKLLSALPLLNIHFSLLPKYRGATPVEAALLSGDTVTGVTVQKMVKAMDEGPLLLSVPIDIEPSWAAFELQAYMDSRLPEVLDEIFRVSPNEWQFKEQTGEPSYCYEKDLQRENGKIVFEELTADEVINRIRAYNPEPMAWCYIQKGAHILEMNMMRAKLFHEKLNQGDIVFVKKQGLAIGCKTGSVLITELVISGSKKLANGDIVALKGSIELAE